MLEVPKTPSPGLMIHELQHTISQVRFVTMKGHWTKSAKGKGTWGETRYKFPSVLAQWSHTGHTQFPQQQIVRTHEKCHLPEKLGWAWEFRVFINAPKSQVPRGKASVQHKLYYFHKEFRLRQPLFPVRKGQGPTFPAGLYKGNSLGPATSTFLCVAEHKQDKG
jgi:hypothetical protein